jgi:hypothetical protein
VLDWINRSKQIKTNIKGFVDIEKYAWHLQLKGAVAPPSAAAGVIVKNKKPKALCAPCSSPPLIFSIGANTPISFMIPQAQKNGHLVILSYIIHVTVPSTQQAVMLDIPQNTFPLGVLAIAVYSLQ